MNLMKMANMGLSFLLELAMLAALGFWGFQSGQGLILKGLLGLGAPLLAGMVWGYFCAPKSRTRLQGWALAGLEIILLGLGGVALYAVGQILWGALYAAALVINRVLWVVWKQ